MGASSVGRVALLSVKPQYADAIFEGRKKIEFRRSRMAEDVSIVVVYATQPVGRVVGWFEVGEVIESTPRKLWRDFSHCGEIDRRSYLDYFGEAKRAFGIIVRRSKRLATPARLEQIRPGLRPPQSFQYLSEDAVAKMLAV